MLIAHTELCQLIPHSGSMCLLEGVLAWDNNSVTCIAYSHRALDNPLRKNGHLSALHAMEYGAQAMAVHGGLIARAAGQPPAPGYLAALRNANITVTFLDDIETDLHVVANQLAASGGNLMYNFEITAANQLIASARATVVTRPT